jgi:hypothetical protein
VWLRWALSLNRRKDAEHAVHFGRNRNQSFIFRQSPRNAFFLGSPIGFIHVHRTMQAAVATEYPPVAAYFCSTASGLSIAIARLPKRLTMK